MILPDGINPLESLYYNGSIILDKLSFEPNKLSVFIKKNNFDNNTFFVLTFDWLFLIGSIDYLIDKGELYVYKRISN